MTACIMYGVFNEYEYNRIEQNKCIISHETIRFINKRLFDYDIFHTFSAVLGLL